MKPGEEGSSFVSTNSSYVEYFHHIAGFFILEHYILISTPLTTEANVLVSSSSSNALKIHQTGQGYVGDCLWKDENRSTGSRRFFSSFVLID
jgi:hypothetical protein